MANKKFSDFVLGTAVSDIDYVVGYKGLDNIQIAPVQLDSTYELNLVSIVNGVELSLEGVSGPDAGNITITDITGGSNITVSLQGSDNIQIATQVQNKITVSGIWTNLFGGSPGIFGDTLEFAASASPTTDNSSVFVIPFDCVLENVSVKWIHNSAVNIIGANTWTVFLYTLDSANVSTTDASNYSLKAQIGVQLTSADTGTFPFKSWDGSIAFSKGDIINVSGVENGTITTDDAEMEAYLTFKETY
jgi:hypothetical protein